MQPSENMPIITFYNMLESGCWWSSFVLTKRRQGIFFHAFLAGIGKSLYICSKIRLINLPIGCVYGVYICDRIRQ